MTVGADPGFVAPRRPWPLALVNAGCSAAQHVGLFRAPLDGDSLVTAARRKAALSDLGSDFESVATRDAMQRLLRSVEEEARLNPLGRVILRENLVRGLVTRLRLEDMGARHPEIGNTPVPSPIFIVGLQRTGTTMLHRLLACDRSHRPLLSWEAMNPAPFPGSAAARGAVDVRDPRIRLARIAERGLRYLAPDFFAIHPVEAEAPEEDVLLLDTTFVSPTADATLRVPSYSAWMESVDQTPAYRYLRRLIQLLLWQRGGRYLGKTPHHLENLDVLLDVFPDAKIIQTHRDPLRVVASFCSMMAHGRAVFSDEVDPAEVGEQLARKAVRAVTDSMAVRDRLGDHSILDVAYADLMDDPIKQIQRIYEFIGTTLTSETAARMAAWRSENPQNKHGVHRYRLEDFSIDREALRADLAPYIERFGLETE